MSYDEIKCRISRYDKKKNIEYNKSYKVRIKVAYQICTEGSGKTTHEGNYLDFNHQYLKGK